MQVTLEPDRPERILDWIIAEHCDVGLTADFAGHPAVQAHRIPVPAVCVLPPGHALAAQAEIAPADLGGERLIHTRRDDPFFRSVDAAFRQCGVSPRTCVETRQFGAACRLVAEGVGVSVVSVLDAREFARTGIEIRPFVPRVHHNLDVLHSRLSRSSMIALEFVDAFIESLAPFCARD
ncbi:LysR substrate-binding domain-containing protein [Rhodovulum sp. ES.010]|uniref:LysR substrate-binding domain-containing protein n=1 Tax=Rhodovulum sp. ES.010 TaxID=1882821 RepID=UPI0026C98707